MLQYRQYRLERRDAEMESKTLLITGFEPFGTEATNPSWEAVGRLPDHIGAYCVERLLLPVTFGQAAALAAEAADRIHADAILCVGLAASRAAITPEAIGVNVRDASIPDNAGSRPEGVPIDANGPAAIFSTLPVRKMVEAIKTLGIPAQLSYSAGTYVCNDLLYSLLRKFDGTPTRVAFIHIPLASVLPVETSARALCAAIEAI